MVTDRQPNILAFVCNWCAYAGADLAGVSRLLKAFLKGADGLLVSG
jgi:F420-non-reducing hydrogenase iron-sulfur subunit